MKSTQAGITSRIRQIIEMAGGPERLAEKVGVTHQAVYGWRAGSVPYRKRFPAIAAAVGVSPAWLENGDGEMAEQKSSSRVQEEPMDCPLHLPPPNDTERMIERATESMDAGGLAAYIAGLLRDAKITPAQRYNIAARLTAQLAHRIATERPPIKYN